MGSRKSTRAAANQRKELRDARKAVVERNATVFMIAAAVSVVFLATIVLQPVISLSVIRFALVRLQVRIAVVRFASWCCARLSLFVLAVTLLLVTFSICFYLGLTSFGFAELLQPALCVSSIRRSLASGRCVSMPMAGAK